MDTIQTPMTVPPSTGHGVITHAVHALARHILDHQLGGVITIDTPTPCPNITSTPGDRHLNVGVHTWALDQWLTTVEVVERKIEPLHPSNPGRDRFLRHYRSCLLPDTGVRVVLRTVERVA